MCNPIFDYDDGDFIYQTSGNMGIDSDGDLHMRIGDNMSMDMDTGELHFNSGWKNDDDDDNFQYRDKARTFCPGSIYMHPLMVRITLVCL